MACGQSGGVFRAREFAIKSIFEMYFFFLFIAFHSAKLFGTDELSETYTETISVSFMVLRDDSRGSNSCREFPGQSRYSPFPIKAVDIGITFPTTVEDHHHRNNCPLSMTMTRRLPLKLKSLVSPSHHLQCRAISTFPVSYGPPPDGPSLVKSFLYGSEKGQELQREMEQSYSKVLARGKYVHKMNQHHVKPDKINEYIALMLFPPAPHR